MLRVTRVDGPMLRLVLLTLILLLSFAAAAANQDTAPSPIARDLAASCAACHGTNGNGTGGFPVLAGGDRAELAEKLLAFRNGAKSATVMHQHAKGYTPEEIELLADYFSQQRRVQE